MSSSANSLLLLVLYVGFLLIFPLTLALRLPLAFWSFKMSIKLSVKRREEICELIRQLELPTIKFAQATDEEFELMNERAQSIKPGFHDHKSSDGEETIRSTWRVARIPYFIEYTHSLMNASEKCSSFATISSFDFDSPVSWSIRGIVLTNRLAGEIGNFKLRRQQAPGYAECSNVPSCHFQYRLTDARNSSLTHFEKERYSTRT